MRNLITLLLVLIATCGHAQNWALINPAYRYNYSNDGTDTISNQIFVTHIDTLGVDSFRYELNGVAKLCDTCAGPDLYLWTNDPQFLQRTVNIGSNVWHFHGPGSFVILPQADIGTSWLLDTLANVQATITSIVTVDQFGVDIPRKTVGLSNGDVLVFSEEYGILSWSGHSLIGVHGPDVGSLVPSLSAFFPYQAGDVVQYIRGYGNCWPCNGYESLFKIEINGSNVLNTAIAWDGWFTSYTHHWHAPFSGNVSHWYTYANEPTNWIAGSGEFPFFDLIRSYPGQLVWPVTWSGNNWSEHGCIAKHGIDENGRYTITCDTLPGPSHFIWQFSEVSEGLIEFFPQVDVCLESQPCGALYREGSGLVYYRWNFFETSMSYVLDATVVGGDTTGVVLTDDQILAVSEPGRVTGAIRPSPNPASDLISITNAAIGTTVRVVASDGRLMIEQRISSSNETINVRDLKVGMYVLRIEGMLPQRFMIVR
ncbi:MAG: T9SS type A sorting domain-containing protein [Flavobacteriales bacterium]|nr:T9SS type A sorting domain-containing protein [Flavobacteriales bacterium]